MAENQLTRMRNLLKLGVPKYVRIYKPDEYIEVGGPIYVVIFTRHRGYTKRGIDFYKNGDARFWESNILSDINEWGYAPAMGRRHPLYGKRIEFRELPYELQRTILTQYIKLWHLPKWATIGYFKQEREEWIRKTVGQQLRTLR